MAEIGNVTVRVDAVITDEQYREAMGAIKAANERMDLLGADNARLREDMEDLEGYDQMLRDRLRQVTELKVKTDSENANLRELLRMAVFVLWSMEQISGLRFVGDGTTFDSAYFKARLRELGIVDSDEWMA